MFKVGFVGLGHMGLPMAINLKKAGFIVKGFDLKEEAKKQFIAKGGEVASNLEEVASNQDIVVTMLQTGEQVAKVCLAPEGVFAFLKPGNIYVDCSTIDVATSRRLHEEAYKRDILSLDAPVSGGVSGAEKGTLTFMVGGSEETLELSQSIFMAMGKQTIYTGESGSGQAAKICNNMILGASMIAISEAFVLASSLGLSSQKLYEVVTHSSGQCWAMSHYVPVPNILTTVPANSNYEPGFTTSMMLKDLNLSQEAADTADLNVPLCTLTTAMYQALKDKGLGELDFSSVIKHYEPIKKLE